MARAEWSAARTRAEGAALDYFRESLTIKSGARTVTLSGVLDSSQERQLKTVSPDGTFPVVAALSCRRSELGFLPVVSEALRISRASHPTEEQLYLVTSVDSTSEMLVIELHASTSDAHPFFH